MDCSCGKWGLDHIVECTDADEWTLSKLIMYDDDLYTFKLIERDTLSPAILIKMMKADLRDRSRYSFADGPPLRRAPHAKAILGHAGADKSVLWVLAQTRNLGKEAFKLLVEHPLLDPSWLPMIAHNLLEWTQIGMGPPGRQVLLQSPLGESVLALVVGCTSMEAVRERTAFLFALRPEQVATAAVLSRKWPLDDNTLTEALDQTDEALENMRGLTSDWEGSLVDLVRAGSAL